MVEERRWPLIGHKFTDLHYGYGLISLIKWRDNYIAWANESVCCISHVSVM